MIPKDAQVFTPYGATEALPVAIAGSQEILGDTYQHTLEGAGVCVGKPVPGLEVKIIRCSDEPIAQLSEDTILKEGQIGEIIVSGDQVTASYYGNHEANGLSKIKDNDRFYHRMGDMGYLDGEGRLWFCGRKSHRVQNRRRNYFYRSW